MYVAVLATGPTAMQNFPGGQKPSPGLVALNDRGMAKRSGLDNTKMVDLPKVVTDPIDIA